MTRGDRETLLVQKRRTKGQTVFTREEAQDLLGKTNRRKVNCHIYDVLASEEKRSSRNGIGGSKLLKFFLFLFHHVVCRYRWDAHVFHHMNGMYLVFRVPVKEKSLENRQLPCRKYRRM
jgi:hypothetical protein